MLRLLKRIARRIGRELRGGSDNTLPGFINPEALEARVAHYRALGTTIGDHVRLIGTIDGINPQLVSIGDYSILGLQSALLTHCPIRGGLPCKVGSYVYIAFNVSVLPGVTIGDHCVVGAGSVVTKDIPEGCVAAGNPARILRELTRDEKDGIVATMKEHRKFGYQSMGRSE